MQIRKDVQVLVLMVSPMDEDMCVFLCSPSWCASSHSDSSKRSAPRETPGQKFGAFCDALD